MTFNNFPLMLNWNRFFRLSLLQFCMWLQVQPHLWKQNCHESTVHESPLCISILLQAALKLLLTLTQLGSTCYDKHPYFWKQCWTKTNLCEQYGRGVLGRICPHMQTPIFKGLKDLRCNEKTRGLQTPSNSVMILMTLAILKLHITLAHSWGIRRF